jgi:hypothetical protein
LAFDISGHADRRYEVQTSSNLCSWQGLNTILATNSPMSFTDTNEVGDGPRLYRLLTLP